MYWTIHEHLRYKTFYTRYDTYRVSYDTDNYGYHIVSQMAPTPPLDAKKIRDSDVVCSTYLSFPLTMGICIGRLVKLVT